MPPRTRSRLFCDLLPWIASAGRPDFSSRFTTASAPCLVRVNTRAWPISGLLQELAPASPVWRERSSRMTRWSICSAVEATGVTATRAGSRSMCFGEIGDGVGHGCREEQRLTFFRQRQTIFLMS